MEALRVGVIAARAEEDARTRGVEDARAREATGFGTLADVIDAERDRADAVATRLVAEADLAAARADLRLLAGRGVGP